MGSTSREPFINKIDWDFVVIDEANRFRNVYKPSNVLAKMLPD
jgi:hypothetical protein